jgi:hypothetical protein
MRARAQNPKTFQIASSLCLSLSDYFSSLAWRSATIDAIVKAIVYSIGQALAHHAALTTNFFTRRDLPETLERWEK